MNAPFNDRPIDVDDLSPAALARRLASRIEALGGDPYAADRSRYAILIGDGSGEIVELGRPLRGSRLFPTKALRRNISLLNEIEAFAAEQDTADWRFWSIKTTGHKTEASFLQEELKSFNRRINLEFSEIRKRFDFKLIVIAVHLRFDSISGLFDLHAHFVCKITPEHYEEICRRLTQAFSKCELPDDRIRNVAAAVTYMLWGVYRPREVISWPAPALAAAWALNSGNSKFHMVRTGALFRDWRKALRAEEEDEYESDELRRRRANRAATMDQRPREQIGDRLLTKATIRLRGQKVLALIVEHGSPTTHQPTESAATVATSQATPEHEASRDHSYGGDKAAPVQPAPRSDPSADVIPPVRPSADQYDANHAGNGKGESRARKPCRCHTVPQRFHWWFAAWPVPAGRPACQSRPIGRRIARLPER